MWKYPIFIPLFSKQKNGTNTKEVRFKLHIIMINNTFPTRPLVFTFNLHVEGK